MNYYFSDHFLFSRRRHVLEHKLHISKLSSPPHFFDERRKAENGKEFNLMLKEIQFLEFNIYSSIIFLLSPVISNFFRFPRKLSVFFDIFSFAFCRRAPFEIESSNFYATDATNCFSLFE